MSRTDSTSANIMRPGLLISGEVEDSINQYTKITVLDTIFGERHIQTQLVGHF